MGAAKPQPARFGMFYGGTHFMLTERGTLIFSITCALLLK